MAVLRRLLEALPMSAESDRRKRLRTFAGALRVARRHRIPLNWWNVRALWWQSKPGWQEDLVLDLTDEEYQAWRSAMDEL